ncbi:MAG: efflux RND transporter permease subunit, partial [Candidatus Omnitrophica bacterium]|nr:efflux RND transporter permease subunit [Candidatus Omnitrophota bacterium]
EIEKMVQELRQIVPKDIKIIVTSNRATFIKTAINNLKKSLFHGILLVILVLYFFMGHLPQTRWAILVYLGVVLAATIAPSFLITIFFVALLIYISSREELRPILMVTIAIPISLIITFGIMELCNVSSKGGAKFTINFITMFGMALGVGMLVDSAIVVFENILKKSEQGIEKLAAALQGAVEMNTVIIGGTITHVIVFLPMVFVKSEMSMLYSGVAWTVTFSLVISTFVSLAIVPLMASRMRITPGNSEFFLRPVYRLQTKAIFWVMRHGALVLSCVVLLFCLALYEYTKLGKEFMGTTEQNKFTVFIELPTGAKLDASNRTVNKVEEILKEVPEVKSFSARVEAWSSKVYVELVGIDQRKRSVQEVIDSLRPKTDRIKPAFIYYEEEREVGTKEIIIDLFGYDYEAMRELAISMATRMNNIKGFTDTKIRMREGRPELGLKIDKQKAGLFDMTTRSVGDSVHAQMRGLRATTYHSDASEVEVIARLDEQYRKTFKDVHNLVFLQDDGSRVTLDQVADFKFGLGPSEIWRKNRSRMIQVSANIGSLSLSKAVELVRQGVSDIKFPENYYYRFGGDYDSLLKNQREFFFLIIIILVLIYIVLAAVFESYYQPFIIMTTVLTATIGCVSGLFLGKVAVGMGALMGMMMLSGIVVNNGIILIDHINVLNKTNKNLRKVLVRVSNERLRPVLMTSIATFIGLVPLAFDSSEGSNLWKPLAVTVIGGLSVSTPLTLLLTPNIYLIFEEIRSFLSGKRRAKRPAGSAP